jgi:hypothetical protein
VLNATVLPPQPLGFLTLWPNGHVQPLVSTLNALDGQITSNMAIVPTSSGVIDAYATDPTQLVLDTSGYFAAGAAPVVDAVTPLVTLGSVGGCGDGLLGGPYQRHGGSRSGMDNVLLEFSVSSPQRHRRAAFWNRNRVRDCHHHDAPANSDHRLHVQRHIFSLLGLQLCRF